MIQGLNRESVNSIADTLETQPKISGNQVRFEIKDNETGRRLALEIGFEIILDGSHSTVISVYSQNSFLQLHNCIGFIPSEMLGQVTFFGKNGGFTTGLIVEKQAGCNMFANVGDNLLKGDFTKLPPELMMCSVALSLTDTIDLEGFSFEE